MDEMNVKLSTRFMKNIISKLIAKFIKVKFGYKVDIRIDDLNISVFNGETSIKTDVEIKLGSDEFMKIMKTVSDD